MNRRIRCVTLQASLVWLIALACLQSGIAQEPGETELLAKYGKRDVSVHDPSSIVECGDEYWLYSTGQFIRSYRSIDLKKWTRGPSVFDAMPGWLKEVVPDQTGHFWAPDIIHLGDRYLLYYSVSTFGKQTSAIALATNMTLDPESPDYRWTDRGIVIQTGLADNFNAIDPAIFLTEDNQLWMSFGSYWSGIKLIRLDAETGLRFSEDAKVYSLAWNRDIEAAHIYKRSGWYYLFINWGKCCRGTRSTYEIRVGRSRSITGPYIDRDDKNLLSGGGSLVLSSEGPFIGPGHANVAEIDSRLVFHCHFYDGSNRGRSRLAMLELRFDDSDWPVIQTHEVE